MVHVPTPTQSIYEPYLTSPLRTPLNLLEPRSLPRSISSQVCVNFARRRTENQSGDGVPRYFDIRESSQDVDFPILLNRRQLSDK